MYTISLIQQIHEDYEDFSINEFTKNERHIHQKVLKRMCVVN